jgi:O-antigen/teichoic acid export membrane protein
VASYSIAANIVQYSLVSISSFLKLLYPSLARAGVDGPAATLRVAVRFLPIMLGIGIVSSVGLFIVSPFLPWLFGKQFDQGAIYLATLCLLPPFVAVHNIAYDALGAAEKHGIRALCHNCAGIFAATLIAFSTLRWGTTGTFIAIFSAQTVQCAVMWLTLIMVAQRAKRLYVA